MPRNPKQNENLEQGKKYRFRPGDQATREAGQKGGIASGKARRFTTIARELLTEEEKRRLILAQMEKGKQGDPAAFRLMLSFDTEEEQEGATVDGLSKSLEEIAASMDEPPEEP